MSQHSQHTEYFWDLIIFYLDHSCFGTGTHIFLFYVFNYQWLANKCWLGSFSIYMCICYSCNGTWRGECTSSITLEHISIVIVVVLIDFHLLESINKKEKKYVLLLMCLCYKVCSRASVERHCNEKCVFSMVFIVNG